MASAIPGWRPEVLKTFSRKVDATRWLADRQAAALRGDLISPEMQIMTVAELAAEWRATWPGRLQPSSQQRADQLLALYVLPSLGAERAATLSYSAVQRFLAALPAALSPSTVRKVHACLSALFTEGIRAGHVRVNPCRHQRLPRIVKAERIVITVEQAEALAVAAGRIASSTKCGAPSGPQAVAAVRLAAYTGLRAGEQWGLRRRDIDLLHGRVHVSRALKLIGGRLEFGPTKTHQQRRVSMPRFLVADVEALLEEREAHEDALLFQGAYGAPIRHNLFGRRIFKPACAMASLPTALRWHDLRHSHGSHLLGRGVPIHVVKERLGHASIQTTVDVYGHLMPGADDDVARLFDDEAA